MNSVLAIPLLPLAGFVVAGTLGKRLGKSVVSLVCCGVMATAFALVIVLWITGIYPVSALLALLTVAISMKAVRIVLEKHKDVRALVPAQAMTIQAHLAMGLLLTLGFVLAGL
jgi:1,4-dihydroxy-2-naphthoate octaprenyltransferase